MLRPEETYSARHFAPAQHISSPHRTTHSGKQSRRRLACRRPRARAPISVPHLLKSASHMDGGRVPLRARASRHVLWRSARVSSASPELGSPVHRSCIGLQASPPIRHAVEASDRYFCAACWAQPASDPSRRLRADSVSLPITHSRANQPSAAGERVQPHNSSTKHLGRVSRAGAGIARSIHGRLGLINNFHGPHGISTSRPKYLIRSRRALLQSADCSAF